MSSKFKHAVYRAARAAGLFALSRRLTAGRLRILAYHGFAQHDEARFRDKLFITPGTFERRLAMLRRAGYPVLGLDQAVAALQRGALPDAAVVITIDDGYASTLSVAGPMLASFGFPATVYLTTYHMDKQTPVFDLAIAYLVWKSALIKASLVWPAQGPPLDLDLASPASRGRAAQQLVAIGKALDGEAQRSALRQAVAGALAVDDAAMLAAGSFRLMDFDEARRLAGFGIEVGLHTHRHRFPAGDDAACRAEIALNRQLLEDRLGVAPRHFCYPSGEYSPDQWPLLAEMGVASATTCDTGLARTGHPPYGLRRFLDGESVSELEFEAELSGFSDLLRQLLRVDRRGAAGSASAGGR